MFYFSTGSAMLNITDCPVIDSLFKFLLPDLSLHEAVSRALLLSTTRCTRNFCGIELN